MVFKKKRRWHCLSGQPITELDKQVMYWENKGKLVPTRELIKTPEQIEGIRRSGVVNTGVLDEVAKHIHAGMNTLEIDKICYDYCVEHGATPACLGYEGYPKSVCTSINEVVCHGIPKEEDVLEEGDIVNVDFTTILDGYYADASRMFIIGKTTPEKEQLVRVAKECLEVGMEAAKPYGFVGDIGHAVQKYADEGRIAELITPCDVMLGCYPAVNISEKQAVRFENGGELDLKRIRGEKKDGFCRVYSPEKKFLGLGRISLPENTLFVEKKLVY